MNPYPLESTGPRLFRWFVSLLTLLFGLFFLIGGTMLLMRGGSPYFAVMGVVLLLCAIGFFRRQTWAAILYTAAFLGTLIWSIYDAGWAFWPLFSRLFAFGVLSFFIALLYPQLYGAANAPPPSRKLGYGVATLLGLGIIISFASTFWPKGVIKPSSVATQPVGTLEGPTDWKYWGGNLGGEHFSAANQINLDTIQQLEVAWTAHTGQIPESTGAGAEDQNTPQQIGDSLYVCTAYGKVLSFDPDTGAEKWSFDPQASTPAWQRCRGLGYYDTATPATVRTADPAPALAPNAANQCARRLYLPTIDARLIALDAETGEPCQNFGEAGTVDLKTGMGQVNEGWYQQTSMPLVAEGLVIIGGRVADNYSTDEPSGVVRAFDAITGELVWAWDPGNPAITGLPPEGETYTRNSPNVWASKSYDPELGLVYLGTGNATPDFYGAQRTEEMDKTSSAIAALDIRTGKPRWLFQTVYHDLWDFDIPAQPVLTNVPDGQGGTLPALLQVTKQGEIFMLNRETGKPIAEVQEKPVPTGHVPGERYSPVQPFSVGMPSIGNETLTESDMWGATPFDLLMCRIAFKGLTHQGVYTPPGMGPTLQFPGSLGGMNWGSAAVDPNLNYMFVNDMRLGLFNYMIPRSDMPDDASGIEMGAVPQEGTPYGAMRQRFLSVLGIPCNKPPFGTMTAIDLKTRQIVWQVPVGTVKETGPLNIPMRLPIPIGMPTLGPALATQGGLLFFAGTQDFYLRAWNSATGEEVWKAPLPVGSQGGPMTYVSPKTGRQYVVITAGGARQSPKRGDYVIAFALPQN
ncbi:MAG: membrane-bound PQQ-dependent dehydrogenase, glucose/quinate/shikimate family [Pigmentiphaga sp.]